MELPLLLCLLGLLTGLSSGFLWGSNKPADKNITVTKPPNTYFQVEVSPDRLSPRHGQEAIIHCRASGGIDPSSLRWTKIEGPLPVTAQQVDGQLILPSVEIGDSGTYVCSAGRGNKVKAARSHVQVIPPGPLEQHAYQRCDPRTQKTCQDGGCIDNSKVCNGVPDCRDGSDERHCGQGSQDCEPNEIKCKNAVCVPKMWICDGDDDCGDRSDESTCLPKPPGARCNTYEFECQNKRQCVPESFHCDGENDCQDGSDEFGCVKPQVTKPPPSGMQVRERETIIIKCTAVGVPTPLISWRKNWGHVCPPPRCTQTSENGHGILTIRDAVSGDSGAYTCEALNVQGRVLAVPDCIVTVITKVTIPCNDAGTLRRTPDGCECKAFATGKFCGQCKANAYWLNKANPQGCLRCFCSGVTQDCGSTTWYRTQVRYAPTSADTTTIVISDSQGQAQPSAPVQVSPGSGVSYRGPAQTTTYLNLPQDFLGDQISAYGGNLKYTITYSGGGSPNRDAVVILKGNEIKLLHKTNQPLYADRPNTIVIPMYETSFQREDGQPCTREHLLMTLADLEALQIKMTYASGQSSVSLSDVVMDIAVNRNTNQDRAWAVEECRCPPGYVGLSCEDCAPGYERSGGGLYLGTCVSAPPPTNCNPFGTLRKNPDGTCVCKKNVIGDKCDICTPPTFFLDARNPYGCIDCFCSGVAETCQSSDFYRIQLSKNFGQAGPGELKVRTKDMDSTVRPRGQPRHGGDRVVFDSFADVATKKALYWELPSFFHGDRVTAYGGGIKYKVAFSGEGAENREPDVVIRGNNIVLYYYHWAGIEPDMDQQVTVNMYESNWRLPDGTEATRPQLMMALSDLDTMLLKMSYREGMSTAALIEASMDITKTGRTVQERALAVEVCDCPRGYTGPSCEDCAPGYPRNPRGNEYLGTCGGIIEPPCRCHGHSTSCHPQTGSCYNCAHNTIGDSCDRCKPGFYGDANRGTPNDCQQCPCPPGVGCSEDRNRQITCQCPAGYTGSRCDQCAPRYLRDRAYPRLCVPVVGPLTSIRILQAPEIQITVNGNAQISTTRLGPEVDHVRWVRLPGGTPVPRHWVQIEMGRIEVRNFQHSDAGQYEIIAYNRAGIILGRAQIRLVVAAGGGGGASVLVIQGKGVKIVQRGSTIELRCTSQDRSARLEWYKVDEGQRTSLKHHQRNGVVTISNAQIADGGEYRCISYIGGREATSRSIYVIVQSSDAVSQAFTIGIDAELQCPIFAIPGMSVSWSKDGGALPPGAIQDGSILRIPNFSSAHEGRYECKVEIEQEFAFGYIQVRVEEGDVLYVEIKSSKSVVAIGDTVTFTCQVAGDPQARIEWTKSSGVMPRGVNVNGSQLSIRVQDKGDGGVYRCTAFARGNTRLTSEAILSVGTRSSIHIMPIQRRYVRAH